MFDVNLGMRVKDLKVSAGINGSTIHDVREACGSEIANLLIDRFGGSILFVPRTPSGRRNGRLSKALEGEDLKRLCAALGGETIVIPIGRHSALRKMRTQVEGLILEGRSASDIARTAQCCIRTVYRLKAEMRAAGELPERAA